MMSTLTETARGSGGDIEPPTTKTATPGRDDETTPDQAFWSVIDANAWNDVVWLPESKTTGLTGEKVAEAAGYTALGGVVANTPALHPHLYIDLP